VDTERRELGKMRIVAAIAEKTVRSLAELNALPG
jgi:hypothetical protein